MTITDWDTVETFSTMDEANDFLSTLKFYPFGTAHEGTFEIIESLNDDEPAFVLEMSRMGYDSRSWDFDAEYFDETTELHTQRFSLNLQGEDEWCIKESLLERVVHLVGYAMAHEGLEWLRLEDGSIVYDPHVLDDVMVIP